MTVYFDLRTLSRAKYLILLTPYCTIFFLLSTKEKILTQESNDIMGLIPYRVTKRGSWCGLNPILVFVLWKQNEINLHFLMKKTEKKKKKYRNHSIADFWADRAKLWNRKMTNPKIEKKKKLRILFSLRTWRHSKFFLLRFLMASSLWNQKPLSSAFLFYSFLSACVIAVV